METPHLPLAVFEQDFARVYEPAEDTFLLLDALEKDLDYLKEKVDVCIECGSGSGTVITAMSKSLKDSEKIGHLMIATDINQDACKTTIKCAKYHNQDNIQVIKANLAEPLVDRLEHQVDLLIFNPPYVPTAPDETNVEQDKIIYRSWAGGVDGCQLIDIFLHRYVTRLLSRPDGVAYMVAIEQNNIDRLMNCLLDEFNIQGSIAMQRKAGIESLYIIKYNWAR